jgi:1,4-dihydroxy-6-naphthoate synthase
VNRVKDDQEDAGVLRFGHSPDPDDAFMFYGFAAGGVKVELREDGSMDASPAASGSSATEAPGRRYRVEHVLEDIQSLNERAMRAELEMTAVSAHAYPFVAERYWVMRTGVSMGDGYGPLVVARAPTSSLADLRGARIAVPGLLTTGMLVLKLFLDEFRPVLVRFDQILEAVAEGRAEAGVVIHEGQLTWPSASVHKVVDLGELWKKDTGYPLPLGLDLVRKDLGLPLAFAASAALRKSIEFAQAHREEAMRYALQFGRGLDATLGDRFVGMYVNDWTLDMGEPGRRALALLLDRAAEAGLTPGVSDLRLV